MRSPFATSPEFGRLLSAGEGELAPPIDLARVALEIAADAYPGLDQPGYLARIDALADRVRDRCSTLDRRRLVLGQINWVLFVEEGYSGNVAEYYDPRNSYLNEVVDRKTGIPISLAVLYGRVAERLGVAMAGVNTPGHFLLRVGQGGAFDDAEPLFVDPFDGGAFLDRAGVARRVAAVVGNDVVLDEGVLAPCPAATVVARMLRNLKSIYVQALDLSAAVPVLRRLAALHPDDPREQRDLAMLCLQLDRPFDAIPPLERLVALDPTDDDRRLLAAARRDAARRN